MKNNYSFKLMAVIFLLSNINFVKSQNIATFDDLILANNSYWNGSDSSGGFTSGNIFFENKYTSYGSSAYAWTGFAYSNVTDTITSGLFNQFGSITGKGVNSSANYAVSSVGIDYMNNYTIIPNIVKFSAPTTITGFYATNNAYAYYSMLNGDGYSKKFGGTSGNDADWFKLQINGYLNDTLVDSVDFYLADFRDANNANDYIVKNWRWVDLSVLGNVDSLTFSLNSSDIGGYGMNTPAYFCMDNFNGIPLFINELYDLQVQIYPNPFTENIRIILNDNTLSNHIAIFDISGKEIISENTTTNNYTMNLSFLTKGVYFVKVTNKNTTRVTKIIKN